MDDIGNFISVMCAGTKLSQAVDIKKATVPYEEILSRDLQDPEEAAAYLNAALEDASENGADIFLLALRDVAKARGIRQLAQDTQLSRESLYRTLSRKGNPRFSTLEAVLESVGLKLAVEVKPLA